MHSQLFQNCLFCCILTFRVYFVNFHEFCVISAVKCNDDFAVLKLLADLGASFDCASKVRTETADHDLISEIGSVGVK